MGEKKLGIFRELEARYFIFQQCEPCMSIPAFPLKYIEQSSFSSVSAWQLNSWSNFSYFYHFLLALWSFSFLYTPVYKWWEKRPLVFSCTIWVIIFFLHSPMSSLWVKQLLQGTFESFMLKEKWHTEQISHVRPKLLFCVRFTGSPGHLSAFFKMDFLFF